VNWNFERRIAMFPAGFDADGDMFAITRFGDFPMRVATGRVTSPDDLFMGWMLLSYRKPAVASSARDSFPASRVTDENPRTYWVAGANRPGETLTLDLGREYEVRAVQVSYTDFRNTIFASDSTVYTQFRLHASRDGRTWTPVADLTREPRRDRANAYVELAAPARARWVRYEHVYTAGPHLAISDVRVFGAGGGPRPATPRGLAARRDRDARNAFVSWRPVRGAVGYNVRWGIAPAKLYQTYQVWSDAPPRLELRALTLGQRYWVAIESFDESGVSSLSAPVPLAY
jgi:xylan 1,4-beta-xylosidase